MMRRPARRNVLVPVLILVCALLGVAVWAQWRDPNLLVQRLAVGAVPQPSVTTSQDIRTVDVSSAAMPQESAFAVIAQRPLFMQARRPPELPAGLSALPQEDASLPGLVVTGIVIAGAESIAILEPALTARRPGRRNGEPTEKALIVRIGDTVGGWTVESVEPNPDRVVLIRGDERRTLELVPDEKRRRAGQRPGVPRRQQQPPRQPAQQPQQPQQPKQPQPAATVPAGQTKAND